MRIALVSSEKSLVSVTGKVSSILKSRITGLEVSEIIAANNLDMVKSVHGLRNFDLVAVILYFEGASQDVSIVMAKLVDFDLEGMHTLKFFEQGEDFDEDEEAGRIASEIMLRLFGKKETESGFDKESYTSL